MQHIAILGSTGSIGTQALEVIGVNPDRFKACVLAAYQNDRLLEEQMERYKPEIAVLVDKEAAERLRKRYRGSAKILYGEEGLLAAATYNKVNTVLTAMVGFAGLKPTLAAIDAGKNIALANKETLVAAGEMVTTLAREKKVAILPVDSEHSAIFQCLQGQKQGEIERILLTASGGPFLGYTAKQLQQVTVEQCLQHPNWSMGKKITVDSATLANKGLEVIEAKWLFGVSYSQIDIIIHPQSIIHSAIEFIDGSTLAQMGLPDMRLPIQYAFSYPDRIASDFPRLDLKKLAAMSFAAPDTETFRALALAVQAGETGATMPCVFNAANEEAVNAFLGGRIGFLDIADTIQRVMNDHTAIRKPSLNDILAADSWARRQALEIIRARS
jgi:1-deoxy-D-xylulose-5-phosphate reductoisomerase